jgi:tRNA(fMet)-specific endonuclease VapC
MPRYLLDTDIFSYAAKGTNQNVFRRLSQAHIGDVCISSIVYAEVEFGIALSPKPERDRDRVKVLLQHIAILDFPAEAAQEYGEIRANLKLRGQPIGANDMLIGAHARYLDLTLVTNNVREFSRIPGLKLENWAE